MAAESLDGPTSLGTFWERGRDRYVPLLLGNLVQVGIFIAFGIVTFLLALVFFFVIGFGAVAAGGGLGESLGLGVLLLGLVVFGLVFLALVAISFVIQFYPIAIVVEGADVVEGYKRSARVVRDNLVSAVGYWVVSFIVGALIVIPVAGVLIFWMVTRLGASADPGGVVAPVAGSGPGFMMSALPLVDILLFSVAGVVLMVVLTAFQQTYATAFYVRAADRTVRADELVNDPVEGVVDENADESTDEDAVDEDTVDEDTVDEDAVDEDAVDGDDEDGSVGRP
jgi:hypothetical protein